MIKRLLITIGLLFALTACTENPTKQAVYTCTSFATLVDVAAEGVRSGKIKVEDKPAISKAIDKVASVCENPIAPTNESLKTVAIAELVKILQEKGVLHGND